MHVTTASTNLAQPIRILRKTNLWHHEFVEEHLRPLRPVILTDAIDHWAALTKWTPHFFKENYGSVSLTIDGQHHRMGDFIDLVLNSDPEHPAPYLHNHLLKEGFPELLQDILPLPHCTTPNWFESRLFPSRQSCTFLELYIGGRGAIFPSLHYDGWHTHAFLMQIYGTKHYVVYPPDQTALLYPGKNGASNVSMVNDVEHPDLDQFPLFAKATASHCQLHQGETLFIPGGWWHTARILTTSVTVSANTANAVNWKKVAPDCYAYLARDRPRVYRYALKTYLLALGLLGHIFEL